MRGFHCLEWLCGEQGNEKKSAFKKRGKGDNMTKVLERREGDLWEGETASTTDFGDNEEHWEDKLEEELWGTVRGTDIRPLRY